MCKFIAVTNDRGGNPILLNTAYILSVQPNKEQAHIELAASATDGGYDLYVLESYQALAEMLLRR